VCQLIASSAGYPPRASTCFIHGTKVLVPLMPKITLARSIGLSTAETVLQIAA